MNTGIYHYTDQAIDAWKYLLNNQKQPVKPDDAEEIKWKGEKQIVKDVILGIREYAAADGDDATYVWLEEAPQRIIDLCDGLLNGVLKQK